MTNVKLYAGCDRTVRPACFHCWCSISSSDYIDWIEQCAAPSTPVSGDIVMYACANKMFIKDYTGTESDLTSGGGTAFWEEGADPTFLCPCNSCSVCGCFLCSTICFSTPCMKSAFSGANCWILNCVQSKNFFKLDASAFGSCWVPISNGTLCWGVNNAAWCAMCSVAYCGASDCNKKEKFKPVDMKKLCSCFGKSPIKSWKWKANKGKRIGPTSQDWNLNFSEWIDPLEGGINVMSQSGVLDGMVKSLLEDVKALELEFDAL